MHKSNWITATLEDICQLGDGLQTGPFGSQLHASEYSEEGVPVVMPKDLINQRISVATIARIPEKRANDLKRHRLKSGDIVFGRRGDIGRCAIVTSAEAGWICGSGSLRVRLNNEVLPQYLIYYLGQQHVIHWLISNAVGQTMLNLSAGILASLPIELPPLPEQRKIAAILSSWDEAIDLTEQLVAAKQRRKQGLMQRLLTGKVRFPCFEGEWNEVTLVELTKGNRYSFTGGPFGSNLKAQDYTETGVRIIQLQNIGDGEFLNDYKIYTSESKADELLSCNIYPGEIILAKMGDPVARATIIPDFHARYLMASDGIRLEVDDTKYDTKFVLEAINSLEFRKKAISQSTGSTRQRISLSDLKMLTIRAPELQEQKKIAMLLSACDDEVLFLQQKLTALRRQKQGLMQQLLTGKIRVKV